MEFSGKTILITGAAGGLGQALCQSFGKRGGKIIALDVDANALESISSNNIEIETICCDLTDLDACCQALSGKSVDVVINNAGITHFSRFSETEPATIERVMSVNFFGAVNITKATLPALQKSRGVIVAISSVAGVAPLFGRTGYSASKHAMHGFFASLRAELRGQGVHVMIACPSFIATQGTRVRTSGDGNNTARPGSASQTVGKALDPQTVAEEICQNVIRRKDLLVIGSLGKLSFWINKLFPRLYEHLMVQKMKAEFTTKES